MTFTTEMDLERETKGAIRYAEDQNDPLCLLGTLYLRKAGLAAKGEERSAARRDGPSGFA